MQTLIQILTGLIEFLAPIYTDHAVPAAQWIFEIAVRRQYAEALTSMFWISLTIVVGRFLFQLFMQSRANCMKPEYYGDKEAALAYGFFAGVVVFVAAFVCGLNLSTITHALLNPEYRALLDILQRVGLSN